MLRTLLAASLFLSIMPSCGGGSARAFEGRPTFAFVTNGQYAFWEPARAGVVKAGQDLQVNVIYRTPDNTMDRQKQVIEDVLNRGIDGLAISIIKPEEQTELIDGIAATMPVVTHDSDAPRSKRLAFVGVDNYRAGRMCGDLACGALPDGGKIAIFVGNLSQDNARLRRQGVLDALFDRPARSTGMPMAANDGELTGRGFTVVGTYTDDGDQAKAKANVEDVLNRHPDLVGIVGLFHYNPAMGLQALSAQDLLGKVAVFGFDEHRDTLQGIEDGTVVGTVVQDPFGYGYQSVKLLLALHEGKPNAVPPGGVLDIPARTITRDNLAAFRAELAGKMAVLEGK